MLSILIVDESTLLRYGLKHVLVKEFGRVIVAEAPNSEAAREQFEKRHWDLVVLGLSPPRRELDLIGELKRNQPSTRILLLGLRRDQAFVRRWIGAGASGYLRKDACVAEMVRAFRRILAGQQYISETIVWTPPGSTPPEIVESRAPRSRGHRGRQADRADRGRA